MKLLIHDLSAAEWEQTADLYKGWTIVSDTGGIRPCTGCFRCWTSGSGECVFRDGYNNMCALIHEADEMTVMSRYTYGGFSSFVKNVFDRSIGYVLPEFETAYGEMHHKKRFQEDKPVTFRFRGCGLSEERKERAGEYAAAVCRNLRGTVKEVVFDECGPLKVSELSHSEPAERSGILFINCSLRGRRSNTGVFLKRLQEDMGSSSVVVSLSSDNKLEKIVEMIGRVETVVMGVPLYVDGIPASALRLMEKVEKLGTGCGCSLYALVNNGLYESSQNVNLLKMIRDFCAQNGFIYRGALAIGAGEVVGTLMRGRRHSLWPARNAKSGIAHLAKAVKSGSEIEDIYADTFLFPRWLYILIANINWQRLKKNR